MVNVMARTKERKGKERKKRAERGHVVGLV